MTDTTNNFKDFENCIHGDLDTTEIESINFSTLECDESYPRVNEYTHNNKRHIIIDLRTVIVMKEGK